MEFPLQWEIQGDPFPRIGFAVSAEVLRLAKAGLADIADLFPFRQSFVLAGSISGAEIAFSVTDQPGSNVPAIGSDLPAAQAERIRKAYAAHSLNQFADIALALAPDLMSRDRFSYSGPYNAPFASWQHLSRAILLWMSKVAAPAALEQNRERILRAIPQPPRINIENLRSSVWVLECTSTLRQGTAFHVLGLGLVTCEHVLGLETQAFRPENPSEKFLTKVVCRNADIDLAVLTVTTKLDQGLNRGTADSLKQLDHLTVAGFPNYRIGDSIVLYPGLVVGFRMVSGIRRVLTNSPIISGMSGGPAIGGDGSVVGVAVTGSDRMETVQQTEHHSVVPIDALNYLLGK